MLESHFNDHKAFKSAVRHGLKNMAAKILSNITENIVLELYKNDNPKSGDISHRIKLGRSTIKYVNTDQDQDSINKNEQKFNEIVKAGEIKFKEFM